MTKRPAAMKQALIDSVLRHASRPLSAKEISDRIKGSHGVSISSIEIGANLGFMHRAREVSNVRCIMGFHRVGHAVHPNMLNHWFPAERGKEYGLKFKRHMARLNENRRLASLPLEKRPRRRARTDDMRQMIEDLGVR